MAEGQQNERLEDQLRRMILINDQRDRSFIAEPHSQARPTVRLPPQNAAYGRHESFARPPTSQQPPFQDSSMQPQQSWIQPQYTLREQDHRAQQQPPPGFQHRQQGFQKSNRPLDQVPRSRRELYDPHQQPRAVPPYQAHRAAYLSHAAKEQLAQAEMSELEQTEKQNFRAKLEYICQEICDSHRDRLPQVKLEGFGSFESGFATAGSDMDLVIVADGNQSIAQFSLLEDDLPRLLEKRLLQLGYGARLLTRTRVPIIKVCELPPPPLLSQLRAERDKWDLRDHDAKYGRRAGDDFDDSVATDEDGRPSNIDSATTEQPETLEEAHITHGESESTGRLQDQDRLDGDTTDSKTEVATKRVQKPWARDRTAGPLDFPKTGVGVQCDINFFNPLGLHNTQMLRCYSMCDQRVRQMVIFVKAWAKRRKINSAYAGTLSSYGYVLMVLHYLVNIARPPVLPNLQHPWRPLREYAPPGIDKVEIDGWSVDFWRREDELRHAAANTLLTQSTESVGSLLAGFFQYYAAIGERPFFHWTMNALSLRSPGGILMKEEKGWVKARTEEGDGKRVQYRYLFCIEDPFELDHNVARTVTHNGIVAIRDEFRRAARILYAIGNDTWPQDGHLFDEVVEGIPTVQSTLPQKPERRSFQQHKLHTLKADQLNTKVDFASKDAFPDLSSRPDKSVKKPVQPRKEQPHIDSTQSADTAAQGPGRKHRRPQRRAVKLNEL